MRQAKAAQVIAAFVMVSALAGCYVMRPSSGGGQTSFTPPRIADPADVAVPRGYRVEVVAKGFTFPTGVAFDEKGRPHVVEAGYSYGEVFTIPRLLRVEDNGAITEIARGAKNGPWTGVDFANRNFYIAEGGQLEGGRILRVAPDGNIAVLAQNLPDMGDHHTNGPVVGRDGRIYFGQGVATNSGVVGRDNLNFGWLKRFPEFHDIPCQDVTLTGRNFETDDLLGRARGERVLTGAFVPFGSATQADQVIRGRIPCSGAIMSLAPEGGEPQLVAWGFRNPFGLAFAPEGTLYVTDNGYDDRGSRPIWGAPDVLWRVTPGAWYGWPDFAAGQPVTSSRYRPPTNEQPHFLLARHPGKPPRPAAVLGVHSASTGFDFSRSSRFGHVGEAFIAAFGDEAPTTGRVLHPVGFRVVRVNVQNGRIEDFMVNKGREHGPASKIGGNGIERPVAARFNPSGDALYVVDFGVLLQDEKGAHPQVETGVLWRITREVK